MNVVPRSEIFDDIYFSPQDGLAETAHVFLQGNNLPDAWKTKDRFVIAETGFGTGLNILSAWKLFEKTAKIGQNLDFISVEKYPLSAEKIYSYLHALFTSSRAKSRDLWRNPTNDDPSTALRSGRDDAEYCLYLEKLCSHYPATTPGFHRLQLAPSVTLTLVFDDANAALARIEAQVDCWFLDGFKPSTNPDMWSEKVFTEMARLSHPGTTLATFTSAGFVRRGLEAAGFIVQKVPGFGTKREMTTGVFRPCA